MLSNKTAVITGGTSGIGEATVKLFARQHANVVFVGTNRAKGERVMAELKEEALMRTCASRSAMCLPRILSRHWPNLSRANLAAAIYCSTTRASISRGDCWKLLRRSLIE